MEECEAGDAMDDFWFFESVRRYNTIQMFDLQNIPDHVLQLDGSTLCIASRNKKCENVELLKLKLPAKLTAPAEEEGRIKENDFKIISGIYIDKQIHQMDAVREERKIVTSQTGKMGLQIYSFELDESGRRQELLATSRLCTPNFAVLQEEKKLVCSQCNHKPLTVYDIYSDKIFKELRHPLLINEKMTEDICDCRNLKCQPLDSNILSVLDSNTGEVVLIDLRTEYPISELAKSKSAPINESWTLSNFDYKAFSTCFGILSTKGTMHLYDIRYLSNYLITEYLNTTFVDNCNILKLKLRDWDRFSISGLDSNVYVYNISENRAHLVFTHDGHYQLVYDKAEYPVNDHIWLPSVGNNFIVSVSENKTINCWEYNK